MCGPQPNSSLQLRFTVQYSVLRIKIYRFFFEEEMRKTRNLKFVSFVIKMSFECYNITITSNDSYIAFSYTLTIEDTLMTNYCSAEA